MIDARSLWRVPAALALALSATAVGSLSLASTSAFAAEGPHPKIGEFGPLTNPNGIAADESSGDVYVATLGVNEQQTVKLGGGPTGGGFTLELEGQKTSSLGVAGTASPSATEVESGLATLSKIGTGSVTVSRSGELPGNVTYTLTFQGALATRSVPQLACDGSLLTGGTIPSCNVAITTPGVEGKVHKFDSNGKPAEFAAVHSDTLTGAGTPAKAFAFPSGIYGTPAAIAVDNSKSPFDPSAGDLYVMDAEHGVIDKFSPSGEYVSQIAGFTPATGSSAGELLGVGVDASGDVHAALGVAVGQNDLVRMDLFDDSLANFLVAKQYSGEGLTGKQEREIVLQGHPKADGFAVAPTGDSFLLFRSCSCVLKFGQRIATLGIVDLGAPGDVAVAADPATDHVFVDNQTALTEWDTGSLNQTNGESETASTKVGASFGSLSGSSGQGAIAVNGSSGRIYASSPGGEGKVLVFGSVTPAVAAAAPSGVSERSATLTGSVDARGAPVTSCKFEYGVADHLGRAIYEHSIACAQAPGTIGSATTPVPVSAVIEGLKPGLLYRFRLLAENASGTGESSGLLATAGEGFGVKKLTVSFLNEDGSPDTQAGSHPAELVNNIEFNSHFKRVESDADSPYVLEPDGTVKDLALDLPPGFVGDPNATPKKCTLFELHEGLGLCPAGSLVGDWAVEYSRGIVYGGYKFDEPIFNIVPPRGVALQLGVHFRLPNLFINNTVAAGGDYPVQATVTNAPASAPVTFSAVRLHGIVGEGATRKPFLTLPTACNGPLRSTVSMDSYQNPGVFVNKEEVTRNSVGQPVGLAGCSKLQFPPTISVKPDSSDASTSSGLTVGVHVPQNAAKNPDGLAESSLRDTTVTLPEGVALNPSGGDGLEGCSEGLAGFTGFTKFNPEFEPTVQTATFTPTALESLTPGSSLCPDGSKIGTVKLKTPLLEHELEGSVYLATQNANPFGSLVAMYMLIEDPISGSTVKLTGEVQLSETGQIVTTFKNTPDLPFEDLELHFFGGERAPLSTPSRCGTYTTQAVFTPWDGNGPVTSTSSFKIEHGPHGTPCPGAALPFSPSLTAGTSNVNAGAFSPLITTIGREDGQQDLQAAVLQMPPGVSGLLSGVRLCPEAQANEGTCGPESLIGETTVAAGVGSDPVSVTGGRVYLTETYAGAPFGLSIVNPVKAGPFDLEHDTANPAQQPACDCVVVRAKIAVDPHSAALTVTTDPSGPHAIPNMIDGIPAQIQKVNVTINRPGFTFNPTSCSPLSLTGVLAGYEAGASPLSVPFQVSNCATLKYTPQLTVTTVGRASRLNGASLDVKIAYPKGAMGSQAWFNYAKFDIPKQLPARLTTLQKACLAATFETNRGACPPESIIGHATVHTPVLPVPLEGPVYFVSYGGAKFPDAVFLLSGYGVTIELHGHTFIDSKTGVTSATFESLPDVPFESIEVDIPQGRYSEFGANLPHESYNFCGQKLTVPNLLKASNGMQINQNSPVAVTGCSTKLSISSHKLKGNTLTLTVYAPAAGKLKATGNGLSSASKSTSGIEFVTLTLKAKRRGKFRTKLHLTFVPSKGKHQSAALTLRV